MVTEVKIEEGAMTTTNELKPLLKRPKLGPLAEGPARTAGPGPQRAAGLCRLFADNPRR